MLTGKPFYNLVDIDKSLKQCPGYLRRNAMLFAGFRCQMTILCDELFRVLIPAHPCDVIPDVDRLIVLANVFMPWGRGTSARYRAARYPDVAHVWTCDRDIHGHLTIDRFRPASAGGLYGPDNVGVLCALCQQLKWQYWPWTDYRPTEYKQKWKAFLQEKYGRQLWLGEEGK